MQGFTWRRITTSGLISSSHVCVGELILTDDGVGNADITLYDGENTNEPEIITVRAMQYHTKDIVFQPYLVTERGLYIDLGSNVNEVLILYSEGTE